MKKYNIAVLYDKKMWRLRAQLGRCCASKRTSPCFTTTSLRCGRARHVQSFPPSET